MPKYALTWADVQPSFVFDAETGKSIELKTGKKKEKWILSRSEVDIVCTETSPDVSEISLALHRLGVKVWLIHGTRVHNEAKKRGGLLSENKPKTKTKSNDEPTLNDVRKARAQFIAELAYHRPDLFRPYAGGDEVIGEITSLARQRRIHLKDIRRVKTRKRHLERRIRWKIISPHSGSEQAILDRYVNNQKIKLLEKELREIEAMLLVRLRRLPIFKDVLHPLMPHGLAVPADIVSCVIDINRFGNRDAFRMYSGVFPDENGRIARKRRGERIRYNPVLQDAIYNFALAAMSHSIEPFRSHYVQAKTRFLAKGWSKAHAHKCAVRITGQKFVDWLFHEWRQLENEGKV